MRTNDVVLKTLGLCYPQRQYRGSFQRKKEKYGQMFKADFWKLKKKSGTKGYKKKWVEQEGKVVT